MTPEEEIINCLSTYDNQGLNMLLQKNADLADGKTVQGVSYLLMAAYYRNAEAVDLIRSKKSAGLDIYESAAVGALANVQRLIELDRTLISSFSPDGFTALGLACFFGHFEIAQYLIGKGAEVNTASNNAFKVAPVHSACAISSYELTELLLKNGANVNLRQAGDVRPLHSAAHNGQTRLVQLLIDYGAEINAKTEKGESALQMAIEKLFSETADLIKHHGGE